MTVLREKCIIGIEADRERCRELLEGSLVTVTALNPYIGYAAAAAWRRRRSPHAAASGRWCSPKA